MSEGGTTKARVIRSGLWVGLAEAVIAALAFVKSVVLARLLAPEMFGLIGLCGIVIRTIETFTRPGIAQALIQRQSPFEDARDTAFTLLLLRGPLLAALVFGLAPVAARFYESEQLEPLLQVLSVVFLLSGLTNINTIACQKELSFRKLTYLNQASALLGTVTTIAIAFWLRNVWALILGQIASALYQTVLSYYFVPGRPRLAFDRRIATELLSYGRFITASSAVIFIASTLDTAVIGKVLGTEQLGYYVIAFTIAHLVTASLSKLASGIMMPAYSRLQGNLPALRSAYVRTTSLVAMITLPATAGVLATADLLIYSVYGSKWADAAMPLRILTLFGLFRAMASVNGYLFEGIGRPQIPLYVGIARLAIMAPLIVPAAARFGLAGAAIVVTGAMAAQWFLFLYFLTRDVGITLRQSAAAVAGPLWRSAAMGGAVYLLAWRVDGMTLTGLATIVTFGVVLYLVLSTPVILELKRRGV